MMSEVKSQAPRRTYKGMNLSERASARKQQFLDAGKEVFGHVGFQAAGVKDVCTAAGLTERYYYEAFGNLSKLFEAVYLEALDHLQQVLDEAASHSLQEPQAQLRSMVSSYFKLLKGDRRLARILIIEVYGAAPAITNLYDRGVRQFAARIERHLAPSEAIDNNLDRNLIATALVGATSSLAMHWYFGGYREPVSVMTDNCFAIFCNLAVRSRPKSIRQLPKKDHQPRH